METITKIQQDLQGIGYFANDETAQAIRAMLVLERPLLIEGPPGVGKTAVAHALAKLFDQTLLRVQCYEGIDALCQKSFYQKHTRAYCQFSKVRN